MSELEKEWGITGLARALPISDNCHKLQVSARAPVSANLEAMIRLTSEGVFVSPHLYALHKGSVIASFRSSMAALMELGFKMEWVPSDINSICKMSILCMGMV